MLRPQPYLAFARAVRALRGSLAAPRRAPIDSRCSVTGVQLGRGASVGPSRSSARAQQSASARIVYPHVVIGRQAQIGGDCIACTRACRFAERVRIGNRVGHPGRRHHRQRRIAASRSAPTAPTTRFRRSAESSSKTTSRSGAQYRRSIDPPSATTPDRRRQQDRQLVQIAPRGDDWSERPARCAGGHRGQHDNRGQRHARGPGRRGGPPHDRQGVSLPQRKRAFRTRWRPAPSSRGIRPSPTVIGSSRRRSSAGFQKLRRGCRDLEARIQEPRSTQLAEASAERR